MLTAIICQAAPVASDTLAAVAQAAPAGAAGWDAIAPHLLEGLLAFLSTFLAALAARGWSWRNAAHAALDGLAEVLDGDDETPDEVRKARARTKRAEAVTAAPVPASKLLRTAAPVLLAAAVVLGMGSQAIGCTGRYRAEYSRTDATGTTHTAAVEYETAEEVPESALVDGEPAPLVKVEEIGEAVAEDGAP